MVELPPPELPLELLPSEPDGLAGLLPPDDPPSEPEAWLVPPDDPPSEPEA